MRKLVLEYWIPLLVWVVTIFFFSTDSFSAGRTSRLIIPILTFFFPGMSPVEIELWHRVIRKFAHVLAYFILAVFAYRSLKYDQADLAWPKVHTIAFVLLVALADEFHQGMTAARGRSIVDVGYDCFGAVWALWLITTYENRRIHTYSVL